MTETKSRVDLVKKTLDEAKAKEIQVLDVCQLTDMTDYMVIASGTSDRHVRSLGDRVLEAFREIDERPIGVEGESEGEWVLLDFGDLIVHLMHPQTRQFYDLESLWDSDLRKQVEAGRDSESA
ncbi:MAG: ribosome silencing factor [Arenicellales bacterium]|jgi:ribosome-associated protein|nr:ribosome silencing factor [Arenicellales bacterium]HJP26691.1 ribosome silencing factor [Arenicellales bacterium]